MRERMDDIPAVACPSGLRVRTFRAGDDRVLACIEAVLGKATL
jgi:hypothetical protein